MNIKLLKEELLIRDEEQKNNSTSDSDINSKYISGHNRIVTEQGSIKLPLIKSVISGSNYKLQPDYQRRRVWDINKKSRLIESFIINIPIPPVFIYEQDFDSYEIMDGLQRISTIIDFYDDKFALSGLEEWAELNNLTYSKLPKNIKEGIDRRQLSTVTLLRESADTPEKADKMKKMVFERLNTGGEKLLPHEIRNALYDGKFNKFCFESSANESFQKLWQISKKRLHEKNRDVDMEFYKDDSSYEGHKLYTRMYDVELVLRFFAMRHHKEWVGNLENFLDLVLKSGNNYPDSIISELGSIFAETMELCLTLFGDKAFCLWKKYANTEKWSKPLKMIYDAICIVVSQNILYFKQLERTSEENCNLLKDAYIKHVDEFQGKYQNSINLKKRVEIINNALITS